jgi:hypothetical protein
MAERKEGRLPEVLLTIAILLVLLTFIYILYGLDILADVAADTLAICAFGGLAISVVASEKLDHSLYAVPLIFAFVTATAIFHAGKDNPNIWLAVEVGVYGGLFAGLSWVVLSPVIISWDRQAKVGCFVFYYLVTFIFTQVFSATSHFLPMGMEDKVNVIRWTDAGIYILVSTIWFIRLLIANRNKGQSANVSA